MQMNLVLHTAVFVFLWLQLPLLLADNSNTATATTTAKPGCQSTCGNLTVPYPFGIGVNGSCSLSLSFVINCDTSSDPPKAFHGTTDLEVTAIFDHKIWVKNSMASVCYDKDGNTTMDNSVSISLMNTSFSLSTENQLTVIGCDDYSLLEDMEDSISACVGICSKIQDLSDGVCSGIGCCQASITKGLQYFYASLSSLNDHLNVWSFNPCGYAFLGKKDEYTFHVSDLNNTPFSLDNVPLVIEWEIGDKSCTEAQNLTGINLCYGESICVDSDTGVGGYNCKCSTGSAGNPYLSPGCIDVDECEDDPCDEYATCDNLPGTYSCECREGFFGDGRRGGLGCVPLNSTYPARYAALCIALVLPFLLGVTFVLYKALKKRKRKKRKQKFFQRNGGLLFQQVSSNEDVLERMKLFSSKELEKATDRFNESRIIGKGGQGTVYKGMLSDGRIVAVKKSKSVSANQQEEFINEVVILSQINHRNVVKLLGCCLETEVPLLVYEFISNGTLFDLIHDESPNFPFSWDVRLRITAEVSNALAYLHYASSVPIYHRDIKSSNILLDEKYRAKVSDFGISRYIALDQTHLTTKVKGTFGYLDPEYFRSNQFTEKSDVYSFGVVMVELLTGQKPISSSPSEEELSLVTRFLLSMKGKQLNTILDPRMQENGVKKEIVIVANLAERCLDLNGRKRPTMKEVATELDQLRMSSKSLLKPLFFSSVLIHILF